MSLMAKTGTGFHKALLTATAVAGLTACDDDAAHYRARQEAAQAVRIEQRERYEANIRWQISNGAQTIPELETELAAFVKIHPELQKSYERYSEIIRFASKHRTHIQEQQLERIRKQPLADDTVYTNDSIKFKELVLQLVDEYSDFLSALQATTEPYPSISLVPKYVPRIRAEAISAKPQ